MHDAVIIGGGLFGSIIAKTLRSTRKMNVLVIDDQRPESGSRPAACLMKPSWLSGLGKDIWMPALRLLDNLYGVEDIQFKIGIVRSTVHWCDPAKVLEQGALNARVTQIQQTSEGSWLVRMGDETVTAARVIVATGAWARELVPLDADLRGLKGAALLWPNERIPEPFVQPWAPYKQLVGFNRGDGAWVGDGTAILMENWKPLTLNRSVARCATAAGYPKEEAQVLVGIRPYTDRSPAYLAEQEPGLWVATGGAKNGTIAAAWCAQQIADKL